MLSEAKSRHLKILPLLFILLTMASAMRITHAFVGPAARLFGVGLRVQRTSGGLAAGGNAEGILRTDIWGLIPGSITPLASLGPRHPKLFLRGGSMVQGRARALTMSSSSAGEDDGQNSSEESGRFKRPRTASSSSPAKKFLIDKWANGTEISRRIKGPGRVPAQYMDAGNGEWVRIINSEEEAQRVALMGKQTAPGTKEMSLSRDDSAALTMGESWNSMPSMSFWPVSAQGARIARGESPNPEPLDLTLWESPPSKWVIFSDLHVSRSTLNTCLGVLERVHEEALQRGAGVIFLGDFWHERGVLRVEPLNAILDAFSRWRVPLIALPGNHDQTSLDGSTHALDPIRFALPSSRIITEPMVMMGALWMPFRRDYPRLKDQMQVLVESNEISSIFCHVDVIGADMGGGVIADRGMHPDDFPAHLPVYTGHYHRPHEVKGTSVKRVHPIRYVGSPYQTSMAEAGEEKALLVVDSSTWLVCEEIPLTAQGRAGALGLRHFKASSMEHLQTQAPQWRLRPGDRVQVKVEDAGAAREELRRLEDKCPGVRFELREVPPVREYARIAQADTLDPVSLFTLYNERSNEFAVSPRAKEMARALLDEAIAGTSEANVAHRDVLFESIDLRGYGSFGYKRTVRYPLNNRGVVLVVGRNEDEQSADSNGSGKTTLCMAALWALTGSADPRADGKSPSRSDVLHSVGEEGRREKASVTLRGTVNGVPFAVTRAVTGGKRETHVLSLLVGGEDRSQQTIKDTQSELELLLPVAAMRDAVFHGQHLVRGLLERTDVDFKKALDNITPSAVWDVSLEMARERKKESKKALEELAGRIKEKEGDAEPMQAAVEEAQRKGSRWEEAHQSELERLRRVLGDLKMQGMGLADVAQCTEAVEKANAALDVTEKALARKMDEERGGRKVLEDARRGAQVECRAAREASSRAKEIARDARAALQAWERAVSRLSTLDKRLAEMASQRDRWEQNQTMAEAQSQLRLDRAQAAVEKAKSASLQLVDATRAAREEAEREHALAEGAYEGALASAAASDKALEAARGRRDAMEGLEGTASCPLCLQEVDAKAHTHNLEAIRAELASCQASQEAAQRAKMEAKSARETARGLVEAARRAEEEEGGRGKAALASAHEELARARDEDARLKGVVWEGGYSVGFGEEEREACRGEVATLEEGVWGTLGCTREVDVITRAVEKAEEEARELEGRVEDAEGRERKEEQRVEAWARGLEEELGGIRRDLESQREVVKVTVSALEKAKMLDKLLTDASRALELEEGAFNPHKELIERCLQASRASRERVGALRQLKSHEEAALQLWGEVEELFCKRGIQSFVYEVAVLELQSRAAGYLERLSDDSLRLELRLEGQVVDRRLLTRLSDGSYASRSLQQLSGGQWRRLGLALTLAFSECSLERTATTCNLIVLDEVMQHLDSEGCARVGRLLEDIVRGGNAVFSTALVILQTSVGEELGDSFDQVDVVVKRGDCSSVQNHDGIEY